MSAQRILITGGGGQLASDLGDLLQGGAEVHAPPRGELDITDDAAVGAVFASLRPSWVINCAAFHNVEVCEREEDSGVCGQRACRQASGGAVRRDRFAVGSSEYELRV